MFRTYTYNYNNTANNSYNNCVKKEMRLYIQNSIQVSIEKLNKNNMKGPVLPNNIHYGIIFGK